MIYLGDIVSPNQKTSSDFTDSIKAWNNLFKDKHAVINLEGLIGDVNTETDTPVLMNDESVIEPLMELNTAVASLANNHVLDRPANIKTTLSVLEKRNIDITGISYPGNGEGYSSLSKNNRTVVHLSYCWDVLLAHQDNKSGNFRVNVFNPRKIISDVRVLLQKHPDAEINIMMHWSFDLETLPFPMYRTFSRQLIDEGVRSVVGCHSHCVQGGETYKDGYIVYGLGNFYFPWGHFTSGKSSFPDWTRIQMVFDNSENGNPLCHWFEYEKKDDKHSINYLKTESFYDGDMITSYSPFRGMSDHEYIEYYKKNRRKSWLIPVYRHHKNIIRNRLIDSYLKARILTLRKLAQKGIRGWHQ